MSNPAAASAAGKLTRGIVEETGAAGPMALCAKDFNTAAEMFYRQTLRKRMFSGALDRLERDLEKIDSWQMWRKGTYSRPLLKILSGRNTGEYLRSVRSDLLQERASPGVLKTVIHLTLLSTCQDRRRQGADLPG